MPTLTDPSEVSICNLALQDLGRGLAITALDENSQAARACRLRYPFARDACLRAYNWNFAAARASLPALAEAPAFGFAHAYQLPGDCLFVREVAGDDACAWTVERGRLLTDLGAPLNVTYTRAETNPASFDALFTETLAARIAADVAVSLTESTGKAQALWQVYQSKLAEARRRDAQEGASERIKDGGWIADR
ncbi:MAG: hypothetical protein ABL996_18170 [Micropepsaceae bacterium]